MALVERDRHADARIEITKLGRSAVVIRLEWRVDHSSERTDAPLVSEEEVVSDASAEQGAERIVATALTLGAHEIEAGVAEERLHVEAGFRIEVVLGERSESQKEHRAVFEVELGVVDFRGRIAGRVVHEETANHQALDRRSAEHDVAAEMEPAV